MLLSLGSENNFDLRKRLLLPFSNHELTVINRKLESFTSHLYMIPDSNVQSGNHFNKNLFDNRKILRSDMSWP